MCADMIDLKKARTRIKELEEELKATREDYEEEIEALLSRASNHSGLHGPTCRDHS